MRIRIALVSALILIAHANADPAWWASRGVKNSAPAANLSPATIGQAKHMAAMALTEMSGRLPASNMQALQTAVGQIVDLSLPNPIPPDYFENQKAVLVNGQLKAIAKPFYDHLRVYNEQWLEDAMESSQLLVLEPGSNPPSNSPYPWTESALDDANMAVATLGQLKAVFSLPLETLVDPPTADTDGDGMPNGWETLYGLNPNNPNDAGGDLDNDGLSNLAEYQNGTRVNFYDSDGDMFPDGFDYYTPGYNPLIFNGTTGDIDGDGLSDLLELNHGSNPILLDTDADGIVDLTEINSGSNPANNLSVPFSPSNHFGGAVDPNMSPMGDLGVAFDPAGQFSLGIYLGDKITTDVQNRFMTEQEAWRVRIGDSKFVDTVPYRVLVASGPGWEQWSSAYQTPSANIPVDGSKAYELQVQHMGVAGVAHPNYTDDPSADYKHDLTFSSSGFLMTSNVPGDYVGSSVSRYATQLDYDWVNHRVYAIPFSSVGYATSYGGNDATGPKYRKISHLGRPLPDEKPESESETDETPEESYVDAFDLSLHHDTSFVSIPLAASDLRLEANATVRETTWSSRSGLRPNEDITSPFGISWSSNLCAYIETTETLGSSTTRPTTVSVVDEGGRPQRFGTSDNMETFFPWPSSLTDKKTYLNTLTKVGDDLVLQKKFGNKLTYRPCDAWFMYSDDRLATSPTVTRHRYWRLEEVEDRFGAKVVYNYGTSTCSLIPVEISAIGRANQKLTITRSTNGRRIESITDAEGKITQFHYSSQTFTVPSTTLSYNYQRLDKVTLQGGAEEHYTYEVVSDAETVGSKVTQHLHANLKSIQRDGQAQRVFHYALDRAKKWYSFSRGRVGIRASLTNVPQEVADRVEDYVENLNKVPQPGSILRTLYGLPRTISMIEWPAMGIQSSFAKAAGTQTTYGPVFSSTNGTEVTDAEGNKYTYTFDGTHGEIIDTDSSQVGGTTSVSTQWLVYHTSTTIEYKTPGGTVLGSETFEFDPNSGLSLKRTVDFSGNETNWLFEESRPAGPRITLENNASFLSKWADPTRKTDALNRIEDYEYGNYRMLTKLTDIHGSITEYTVDSLGRRTVMTVKDSANNLIQRETYDYTNATFPGFMTKKTRKVFANLSGKAWEQDLVVDYVADSRGRLWKEIVDSGGANLETVHAYDLNNRKVSTTDARGLVTQFEYDDLGRLVKTIFPDSSFKTYAYNASSAKIRETDENGNSTLFERDGLNRITQSARDMNGNGLIDAGDLVTQFGYNDVGLVRKKIDPRGFATVTFYDELHRPQHVFSGVPQASADDGSATLTAMAASSRMVGHQEFTYNVAQNAGGGLLQPFQPTSVTRRNVVSMDRAQADVTLTDTTVYDDVYRPTSSSSEYAPGLFKTTQFNYGTVNGSGHEPLVSTVTDSLGKVTRTTRDALGREIEIIDGFGNSNADFVLTTTKHYTSTGLLWRIVDPLSRHTETEYDSVGRPVKAYQPDPVTGLITANSPVTESVFDENGNVSAVIDANLNRTDFDYDNRNRKWRTRQPAVTDATNPDSPVSNVRPTTTVYFDNAGNEIAVTDPRGSTIRKFYDKANRVFKTRTNPVSGNPSNVVATPGTHDITTTTEYDNGGLALSVEDGNGNITRNAYDNLGRLTATACDPSDGNPAALPANGLDPAAYRTNNATSALVSYIHDDSGNVIEVTDGESHQTAFTFDGLNRKTSIIWDPGKTLQRTESFEFNALVQTSRVDGKNHRTNFEYDSLHRLTDVVYRANTSGTNHIDNRHLTYDKGGKVLNVTYPNEPGSIRNVTSVFDKLDRLTSETSAGVTHTYPEYDKAGNRMQTTYGRTGTTLVSTYDALNRLETCEERSNAATPSGRTTTYQYDLGGLVTLKTLPNGNATTSTRDKLGRTLQMIERTSALALVSSFDYSQAVGSWPYSHDALGNVLRCEENHTLAGMTDRVVDNNYDHCNRLDTETITPAGGTAVTTDYDYDLANNRTFKTLGTSVTEYKFGNGSNGANSNQLREYGPNGQAATHTFTHDNNGNRETRVSSAGTETYTWDDENRLVALDTPGGDYAYTYDHRSRRIVRDESAASGSVTELTFSGGTSVQEATTNGTVQVELIRGSDWGGGIGGVLFTIRSGQRSYNAYNSRGDVVSVTNDSGTATWQASYEAFGTRTEEDGTNTERQRANTKDEDPTGLLNEGFRYRDLEAGVFISRDPLGFVDGPNVYTYVRQNPWTKFDPLGLWETDSYWGDVGKFYSGMGKAAVGLVKGVATSVVDLPQNLATIAVGAYDNATDGNVRAQAGATLAETGSAIKASVADYGSKIAAGKMETLGDATFQLLSIATPLAASKATTAANIAKAERAVELVNGLVATAETGRKGATVTIMISKEGSVFSGGSLHSRGLGVTSPGVEAMFGSARSTCGEARALSAMEAAGVKPRGAVSISAAVNRPGIPNGKLIPACKGACEPVLKKAGVHDLVSPSGAISPQTVNVPKAAPAIPVLDKVQMEDE